MPTLLPFIIVFGALWLTAMLAIHFEFREPTRKTNKKRNKSRSAWWLDNI